MRKPLDRRLALGVGLSLVATLALTQAAPAGAAESGETCRTILSSTPGVTVDLDGDGVPEHSAPRVFDVTLCSDASAGYVVHPPTVENCSGVPRSITCMAVRATILPAYPHVYAGAKVCFTQDGGWPTCVPLETPTGEWDSPRTVCVGYDLEGGHPCDGSLFALE